MNSEFVAKMWKAGQLAGKTLKHLEQFVKPGATTNELDVIANKYIIANGGIPANVGYNGFPATICSSNNSVVCHGVPDDEPLKDGDLLKIDLAVIVDGHFGDTCHTFLVGQTSNTDIMKFRHAARDAMYKGIEMLKPGVTTGDIGFVVNKFVTRQGYSIVRELCGHGIGTAYHMTPNSPYEGKKGRGYVFKAGDCVTVEPILAMGNPDIKTLKIKDSNIMYYKTLDDSLVAQFEHTVLITDNGHEILTLV